MVFRPRRTPPCACRSAGPARRVGIRSPFASWRQPIEPERNNRGRLCFAPGYRSDSGTGRESGGVLDRSECDPLRIAVAANGARSAYLSRSYRRARSSGRPQRPNDFLLSPHPLRTFVTISTFEGRRTRSSRCRWSGARRFPDPVLPSALVHRTWTRKRSPPRHKEAGSSTHPIVRERDGFGDGADIPEPSSRIGLRPVSCRCKWNRSRTPTYPGSAGKAAPRAIRIGLDVPRLQVRDRHFHLGIGQSACKDPEAPV